MPAKRQSYTAAFKLKVVNYSKEHGKHAAERQFGVCPRMVRRWCGDEEGLKELPRSKRARRGRPCFFPDLEAKLVSWVHEMRAQAYAVSRQDVRWKALELSSQFPAFTKLPSENWCSRFMARNSLCLRARTKLCQRLPPDLTQKVLSFQRFVIRRRTQHSYGLDQIGNMDETPVTFDMPSSRTVEVQGVKSVPMRTSGHEKTRFTVVLACLADGTKLMPMVIFRRKTLPKGEFPAGLVVKCQPKGWMDESLMKEWIKQVWLRRVGGLRKTRALMVWDSFSAHLTDDIKEAMRRENTDLAVIPGGLTSMLQPLDVSINKSFKSKMRAKWQQWFLSESAGQEKPQRASLEVATTWISEAWNEVDEELIRKAFKKASISNKLDGSEDDKVYEHEDDATKDEESDEDADDDDEENEEEEEEDGEDMEVDE